MQDAMDNFVSGKIDKPSWAQYLQVSEDQLFERLNRGRFAATQEAWNAEKEIIAMVLAEKTRRRARCYNAAMMGLAMLSAFAAWAAALQ